MNTTQTKRYELDGYSHYYYVNEITYTWENGELVGRTERKIGKGSRDKAKILAALEKLTK